MPLGVFNPKQLSRGDIQQPAYDRPEDEYDVVEKILRKQNPRSSWDAATERARAQEAQADRLRSQAQHPEGAGMDESGSSKFQSNGDIFTDAAVNQVRGEREIKEAGMSPANITPGAKGIGKGGVITDGDMNVGAVGHQIGKQGSGTTTRQVSGRPEFYRMRRFYGR